MILMVDASYAFGDVYDNAGGGPLNLDVLAQNFEIQKKLTSGNHFLWWK